jgi:hypothetical protein
MDTETQTEINELKAAIARLEASNQEQQTGLDAAAQAIAAMKLARRNHDDIKSVSRQLRSLVCLLCGLVLLWLGRETWSDALPTNDEFGKCLLFIGSGFMGFGFLVSGGNEAWILEFFRGWVKRD